MGTAPTERPTPSHEAWTRLYQLARRQHGAFAIRQAVACGIERRAVVGRMQREAWDRPYQGTGVLPGREVVGGTRVLAAALSVGPAAVVTARPALALHGLLDPIGFGPHLVVPIEHRPHPRPGVRISRSRTLTAADHTLVGEVALATVRRAFLDAAATTSQDRLRQLLVDARQRRLLDPAVLLRDLDPSCRVPGAGRLRTACRQVLGSGADSSLVAEVEAWLCAEGVELDVPPRTVPVPGRVLHPDLTLARVPVGIEVDGFAFHADRVALDLDQRKHNAYQLVGWTVLRIGWDRWQHDRYGFLAELMAAVAIAHADADQHG